MGTGEGAEPVNRPTPIERATRKRLTRKQAAILEWVSAQLKAHGFPPTMEEIAAEFGFASTNAVYCHLRAIERKGYVHRTPNIARGLRLL